MATISLGRVARWAGLVLLALFCTAVAFICIRTYRLDRVELKETLRDEVVQLDIARQMLNRGRIPYDWDAAAYLNEGVINRILDTYQGTTFQIKQLPNVTFEIESLDADIQPGSTQVEVALRASYSTNDTISARVHGKALLILKAIETSRDPGMATALFRISMLDLKPSLSFYILDLRASDLLQNVASAHVAEALGQALIVRLPLRVPTHSDVKVDSDDEVKLANTNFKLKLTMPVTTIGQSVEFAMPLSIGNGIWLLVRDGPAFQPLDPALLSSDPVALRQTIDRLQRDIQSKSSNVVTPKSDVALWLGKSLLQRPLLEFGSLAPESRRVHAEAHDLHGTLVDATASVLAHDNVGLTMTLASTSGDLQIDSVQPIWHTEDGLHAAIHVTARASAVVKAVIGTVVGGGISTDSTLTGEAQHTLDIRLALRPIQAVDQTAIMFGPLFSCQNVPVLIETTGDLRLGLRLPTLLLASPASGSVLIDTVARYQKRGLGARGSLKEGDTNGSIRSTWSDLRSSVEREGYLATANLNIAAIPDADVPKSTGSIGAFQGEWKRQTQPKCPKKDDPEVLFAGQKFGPNNDFVKAALLIFDRLKQANAVVVVSWDRFTRVVKKPSDIDDVGKEVLGDVKKAVDKAWHDLTHPHIHL
ncbi:hypothetical protein [Luteibacter aegosomatissinici]|uniref:hypothetical protein n=1 Tax=Luteibacter aegosomatissinici TaxID=2911539 RepID=UPI001FFA0DC3|nr:hypothetical protein [Luteibacter aegosomatissinici]UPG93867.1 hypothetical protein L2Y97_18835 [Luteibacter aegosomatissinici]